MAISLNNGGGNGGGGFGSRRQRGTGAISEINVTPFVDLVLVLLIIFMITAHVMQFGLEVDVPKTKMVKETPQEMPVVTITKDGLYWLNGKTININDLKGTIQQRFGKSTKGVYVMADRQAIWDIIAQVTAELGAGGFQVYFVTQPADAPAKGK
ncbi:MAG TPA: biopolymer transporter ExbD [Bryobacteraceae bacterium]|nr:biopolymer transporter ExbD [Bryobacteraceae bacterium]